MWEMFKYLTFLDDIPRLHRGGTYNVICSVEPPATWPIKTSSGRSSGRKPAVFVMPSSSASASQPPTLQVAVTNSTSSSYVTAPVMSPSSTITDSSPSPTPVALTESPTLQMIIRKTSAATATTNSTSNNNSLNNANTNNVSVIPTNNSNILTTFIDMADGCSAFGMSVSATLRTLPLEQQELAKLRIQQVLYEVQFS